MKKIILSAAMLLSVAGALFAQPTDFDFELTTDQNIQDLVLPANKIVSFQWWYEPDLSLSVPNLQGIPQNVIVSQFPQNRIFGDQYAYYPSDRWHTTLLEFPADLLPPPNPSASIDVRFRMPIERIGSFAYLEDAGPRLQVLNNRFFIRDVETFASYDAAQADIDNESNGAEPVPEPSSILLLLTGLFGVFGFKFRRRFSR